MAAGGSPAAPRAESVTRVASDYRHAMTDRPLGLRSATELVDLLNRREVSSRELLQHFVERNDTHGPAVNAIVTVDLDAAGERAAQADAERATGVTAPLLGLPMTIKDALATNGLRSTGGAVELADHVPEVDAEAVARVRHAGAVIFGKTNLPRWSGDAQAYNEIFGTTNNPWDLACGPGGSSGGASAAVAAGLTGAEVGTDIGGSVRLPAHFTGVCSHKPTFGIVPQLGYISHPTYPMSEPDINVVGPITRSVDDCELLLDVLAGPRSALAAGWKLDLPPARHRDPKAFRVGAHLDDAAVPVSAEVADALALACAALEASGVSIDRSAWPDDLDFSDVNGIGLPLISAATSPGRDDAQFDEMRQIVLDPSAHGELMQMRARATAMFHRDWLLMVERREVNRRKWERFFGEYDVLLAPVAHVGAFPHMTEGHLYSRKLVVDGVDRPYGELIMWTGQFGYVGLPVTVVPIAIAPRGVPIGIQVVGPHFGDRTTIEFARHIERVLGGYHVPPGF